MKKLILIGVLGGIVVLIIGMLTGQIFQRLFPALTTEYQNVHLFRTWSDPVMLMYFVHPFFFGIAFAWVWKRTNTLFAADTDLQKAFRFGFASWMVSTVPGMMISYASFAISPLMVLSWTVSALIEFICLGLLFSRTMK